MKLIGLTGSIAMGKTTTARMFAERGVAVFDADAAVHRLYAKNGQGVVAVAQIVPGAVIDGAVDRRHLAQAVGRDHSLLTRIESAIHPLVREAEEVFISAKRSEGAKLALIDVPLLFETGRQDDFDAIVVVSAPGPVQRARALARPGMTDDALDFILARQLPDAEKRRRADFVIETGGGLEQARRQVDRIVDKLAK